MSVVQQLLLGRTHAAVPAVISCISRCLYQEASPMLMTQHQAIRSLSAASDAEKNAEKLLQLMSSSPALQKMIMATLPTALQGNPDVIKAMLADPGIKKKMAEMISKQGMKLPTHMLEHMNASHMEETMARLQRLGFNPTDMPKRLMAYPELFKKLQEPRVMQAFMETADNPAAAARYDDEVLSVVRKAQELLRVPSNGAQDSTPSVKEAEVLNYSSSDATAMKAASSNSSDSQTSNTDTGSIQMGPPPPAEAPSNGSTNISAEQSGDAAPQLPPQVPFMELLMRDPKLASKLQHPRVQAALQEISKSPWKTVKYVMDRDVMEVFTALNKLIKSGGKT